MINVIQLKSIAHDCLRIFLIHSLIIFGTLSVVFPIAKANETTEALVKAVNTMRTTNGLSKLTPDSRLFKAAQQRMVSSYFAQPGIDQRLSENISQSGFLFYWVGECQALGGRTASDTLELWLNDPQCSQLLKRSSASHLGVAYKQTMSRWVLILAQSLDPLPQQSILDQQIQEGLNRIRTDFGLSLLYRDKRLDRAAYDHAYELMKRGLLSHESQDGSQLDDRVTRAGFPFLSVAENLAQGTMTISESLRGWMNSPGHRYNMLMPALDRFGFAVTQQGNQRYWVLILALIDSEKSKPTPSP